MRLPVCTLKNKQNCPICANANSRKKGTIIALMRYKCMSKYCKARWMYNNRYHTMYLHECVVHSKHCESKHVTQSKVLLMQTKNIHLVPDCQHHWIYVEGKKRNPGNRSGQRVICPVTRILSPVFCMCPGDPLGWTVMSTRVAFEATARAPLSFLLQRSTPCLVSSLSPVPSSWNMEWKSHSYVAMVQSTWSD